MPPIYQYAGLDNTRTPGFGVEECAARIHHLAYVEERLMFLQAAHIISVPERDVKVLLARLQYEDSQHSDMLRSRLPEMRVSKKKAASVPSSPLAVLFDEAMHAANTAELLASLVLVFKPALLAAYEEYLATTNDLADYPTVRLLKLIVAEEAEGLSLLTAAYQEVAVSTEYQAAAERWALHLQKMLDAAGGVDGSQPAAETAVSPQRAGSPYVIPRELARDDAFPRVWDFVHVENEQVNTRLAQMISTRLSEVTVAEGLALVLCETPDQPWAFYADLSRHLWDEMRHSLFGEAASEDLFGDRAAMPVRDFEAHYLFKLTPLELYALIGVGVEAALMKYPPGKREEFEFCRDAARYPLMRTFQDFDWADEVLHVNIARRQLREWYDGEQSELVALAQQGLDFRASVRHEFPQEPLPDLDERLYRRAEQDVQL
ncbi:MAG: hypothetical protein KDI55_09370 [Anaerolineae bacterium]|nr:hypothetical protein [Anaerolineae bacterium]